MLSIDNQKKVLIFSLICLLLACASIKYFGNNNPIEIVLEDVIEAETGIKIDLDKE